VPHADTASKGGRQTFFPSAAPIVQRPRGVGITHVLDRLHHLDPEELRPLAPYVDFVKIGWGLPLLIPREQLRQRIAFYHSLGLEVSTAGALLEYAITRDQAPAMLAEAKELGFDLVEVSEGIIELSARQIERLADEARRHRLDFFVVVGRVNPQNQLSLRETIERIVRARALRPRKIILESRESGRGVGIYDIEGQIKWDWVRSILADVAPEELIFEAPLEAQQIGLLKELSSETNLGNVALTSIAPLASQRLGLRGDTFGALRHHRGVKGPPATKFLYYLLESYRGLDQSELVRLSRLPRRTVQSALDSLRREGLIREGVSLVDSRRREYRLT
jgi:phosphosulfolactate synthase